MGRRLHLLANSSSGKGHGASIAEIGRAVCKELQVAFVSYPTLSGKDLEIQTGRAIEAASRDQGVIAVAGGDGTVRTVAQLLIGTNIPLAVIPCGTFNFFARAHGIPLEPDSAFRVAAQEVAQPVRLGDINGNAFLINASLGVYARSIQERERRTRIWGRNQLVVILSTMMSFFARLPLLNVELRTGTEGAAFLTPMIFIGNNSLQFRNLAMAAAACMSENLLGVIMMKPLSRRERFRIILRGLMKTLNQEDNLISFCVDSLEIRTTRARQLVALDGELFHMNSPLIVQAMVGALLLVKPKGKAP